MDEGFPENSWRNGRRLDDVGFPNFGDKSDVQVWSTSCRYGPVLILVKTLVRSISIGMTPPHRVIPNAFGPDRVAKSLCIVTGLLTQGRATRGSLLDTMRSVVLVHVKSRTLPGCSSRQMPHPIPRLDGAESRALKALGSARRLMEES